MENNKQWHRSGTDTKCIESCDASRVRQDSDKELRSECQGGRSELGVKEVERGVREDSPYNYQRFGTEVEVPGLNSKFRNGSRGSGGCGKVKRSSTV